MSVSQFTVYTASDPSGPGLLTGQAGSLLSLLDACLVNGYSGKTAAGWTKPFSNSGSIGCYKQGAGSGLGLVINDDGPNVSSTFKEAWATGWEVVAGVGSPVGSGSGQFPLPSQLLTTGQVVVRKSASADTVGRWWILFADASTFYLFVQTGDTSGIYYNLWFGDIFSLAGAADKYRCILIGGNTENTTSSMAFWGDLNQPNTALGGHYMARTWGGTGSSIQVGKGGDTGKNSTGLMGGVLQTPNGPDGSYYLSPVVVVEPSVACVRGRLRGLFQVVHPIANFSDGQTFAGGGDYAGKTFQIVKSFYGEGTTDAAYCAMETSNTVETN